MRDGLLIFCFISISFFFSRCKKENDKYYLTSREKFYASFKEGSYWIFQNDSTLIQDSLYIASIQSGFEGLQSSGVSKEHISCFLKSSVDPNLEIVYSLQAEGKNSSVCYWGVVYCCDTTKTSWSVSANITEEKTSDRLSGNQLINTYDQNTINGNTFYSVYELMTSNVQGYNSSFNITKANAFVMKYVGFLKWNIRHANNSSESWSLLRYRINL